ncbi:hypothetical protein ES703_37564 [subsurface metagenome]
MALSIVNWNIAEKSTWFVRLADSGSSVSVEIYVTQADAEARTNLQASGESPGYGSGLEIELANEEDAATPVSLFQEDYSWHLTVTGQSDDDTKIFKVKEFVEMDEISHSIYRNSELIAARATAEINAHTHAAIVRNISLATHLPDAEPGDIAGLDSTRRGVDDLSQVYEHQIVGTPDSLISEIETRKYLELKR